MEDNEIQNNEKQDLIFPFKEKIDSTEVEKRVRSVAEFYNLPEENIQRALATEAFVVTQEQATELVHKWYCINYPEDIEESHWKKTLLNHGDMDPKLAQKIVEILEDDPEKTREKNQQSLRQAVLKTMDESGGLCLPIDTTKSYVLIFEEATDKELALDHEIIHVLADKGPKLPSGFQNGEKGNNLLNEAATEFLRLSKNFPEMSVKDLFDKIVKGEISAAYKKYVMLLMTELNFMSQGLGKPFGAKELAEYYFDSTEKSFNKFEIERLHGLMASRNEQVFDLHNKIFGR